MTRLRLVGLAAALLLCATACGSGRAQQATTTVSGARLELQPPGGEFGWIRSMKPLGNGYVMWFDVGQELSGTSGAWSTSAERCVAHGACPTVTRARGVPDDVVQVDLKYALPYYVPATTPVVLSAPRPIPCTVGELYQLVHGRDPRRLRERALLPPSLQDVFGWNIRLGSPFARSPYSLQPVLRIEQVWHP